MAHSERGRGEKHRFRLRYLQKDVCKRLINNYLLTEPPRAQVPSCWTPATCSKWRRAPRIALGPARASCTQSQRWGLRGGAATCWPQGEGFWVEQEVLVAPGGAGCGRHGGHAKNLAFQLLSPGLLRSRAWVFTAPRPLGLPEGWSSPRCTHHVGQRGSSPHASAARAYARKHPRAAVVENSQKKPNPLGFCPKFRLPREAAVQPSPAGLRFCSWWLCTCGPGHLLLQLSHPTHLCSQGSCRMQPGAASG